MKRLLLVTFLSLIFVGVPVRTAIARPADKPQANSAMVNRFPGIGSGWNRISGRAPVRRRQSVPFHLVMSLGEHLGIQQLTHDDAIAIEQME